MLARVADSALEELQHLFRVHAPERRRRLHRGSDDSFRVEYELGWLDVWLLLPDSLERPKFIDRVILNAVSDREAEALLADHLSRTDLVVCTCSDDIHSHSLEQREVRLDLGQMPGAVRSPVPAVKCNIRPASTEIGGNSDGFVANDGEGEVWKRVARGKHDFTSGCALPALLAADVSHPIMTVTP